jgi:dTDP-4-amino-4,6-dideoxygalactose transaminase
VGRELGGLPGECPVSEEVSERLVRLPFFNTLTHEEQAEVIEAVVAFRP